MLPRARNTPRALRPEHWTLLSVLGCAGFFEGFDSSIFTVVLPQIRGEFGLDQAQASSWLALLVLGALPALFVTRWADVWGRKRLLILSVAGYSIFSGVTAIAPTMELFVAAQFASRLFLHAECAVAWTMVAEELPARARGFGFGWVALSSGLGSALAPILYGLIFSPLGVSWRWLYAFGLLPLGVVFILRRTLNETSRYQVARDEGGLAARWHEIFKPPHRRWFLLIGWTDLLIALSTMADVFAVDFMQTDVGFSPGSSSLVLVVAGAIAMPFLLFAGSLSDRYGRRLVGCSFLLLTVGGTIGFFLAAQTPTQYFICLTLMLIGQFGAWPTLDAFYAELFPTRLRALGGAAASAWKVPGESLSLMLGSLLISVTGGVGPAVAVLAIGPIIAVVVIMKTFPETRGVELEEITYIGDAKDVFAIAPPAEAPTLRPHPRRVPMPHAPATHSLAS